MLADGGDYRYKTHPAWRRFFRVSAASRRGYNRGERLKGFDEQQPPAITYDVAGFLQFADRDTSLGASIPQARDELADVIRAECDEQHRGALGLGKTGAGYACENFLSGGQSGHLCSV